MLLLSVKRNGDEGAREAWCNQRSPYGAKRNTGMKGAREEWCNQRSPYGAKRNTGIKCARHGAVLGGESPLHAAEVGSASLGQGVHREGESEGSR